MSLSVTIKKELTEFVLDVDFQVESNEVLGLLGASGSGKSMTLQGITGIQTPDSGEVSLNGEILYSSEKNIQIPTRNRNIGILFQNYALFPKMTVEKNLLSAMKDPRDLSQWIERFHLQGLEKKYPRELSGGEQQRVASARMMAAKPKALLFDEPFSALDQHLRRTLERQLAKDLAGFSGPTVLVTHNPEEAYRLCDRIAFIDRGKIMEIGDKEKVYFHPKSLRSLYLLGYENIVTKEEIQRRSPDYPFLEKISGLGFSPDHVIGGKEEGFTFFGRKIDEISDPKGDLAVIEWEGKILYRRKKPGEETMEEQWYTVKDPHIVKVTGS